MLTPTNNRKRKSGKYLKRSLAFLLLLSILAIFWFQWWHLSRSIFPLSPVVTKEHIAFTLAAPLPSHITEAGGAAYQNNFYILGGIDAFGRTVNKFWEYDANTDNWKRLPDVPAYINHPGVVAIKGKIYVIGGFDPIGLRLRWLMFADWKPLNTVYIFDISTVHWSKGPDMPVHRGAGGIAGCDSAIWYVGGINEEKKIANDFFYLSIADNSWHRLPSMPTPRDHLRMEMAGNNLYAMSGRKDDLRKNLGAVEAFSLTENKWTSLENIPTPRGGFGSVVSGRYIYTFGGESFFSCFNNIERLDIQRGKWEKLPSLPEARHGIVAGLIRNKIHLVSGGRHPRISTSNIHRVMEVEK